MTTRAYFGQRQEQEPWLKRMLSLSMGVRYSTRTPSKCSYYLSPLPESNVYRYILLDKQIVDFANTAINRPDMKGEHDIFNRVMPRDDIGVLAFLENRVTGSRLIV